jgi:hypothetical protein
MLSPVEAFTAFKVMMYWLPMEAIEPVIIALMALREQIWRPISGVMRASAGWPMSFRVCRIFWSETTFK